MGDEARHARDLVAALQLAVEGHVEERAVAAEDDEVDDDLGHLEPRGELLALLPEEEFGVLLRVIVALTEDDPPLS